MRFYTLYSGVVICNYSAGEKLEILEVNGYYLKMKSLLSSDIITMRTSEIKPEEWWIYSIEE